MIITPINIEKYLHFYTNILWNVIVMPFKLLPYYYDCFTSQSVVPSKDFIFK